MPCEMITLDYFAIPETNHGVHSATYYFSRGCVSTGWNPLFMSVFLVEKLSDVLAAISEIVSLGTGCTIGGRGRRFRWRSCFCRLQERRQVGRGRGSMWWSRWGLCATELEEPYKKYIKNSGVTGSWTQGLVHAKHALYQLSYNPVMNTVLT